MATSYSGYDFYPTITLPSFDEAQLKPENVRYLRLSLHWIYDQKNIDQI